MNTADRSLAVVDFALRRRFAWYTMTPHDITSSGGRYFDRDLFNAFGRIFERHAGDELAYAGMATAPGKAAVLAYPSTHPVWHTQQLHQPGGQPTQLHIAGIPIDRRQLPDTIRMLTDHLHRR